MKKNSKKVIVFGLILILGIILVVLVESGNKNSSELFASQGKFVQAKRQNGLGAIYNDEYIYFKCCDQVYASIDKSNINQKAKLIVNCKNSACSHTDEKCEAYVESGEYFVFNDKIYKCYNESKISAGESKLCGYIVDYKTGEKVFSNSIPEDIDPELAIDDSESILYVRVISDDIVKIDGDRHAYLLDKDFNIIYCHYNIGKYPWGAVLNGKYYYVNDINELVEVDLDTKEEKIVETNGKAFMADNDMEYIYYTNEYSEMYKMSLADGKSTKIAEEVLMFSVQEQYIYASGGTGGKKKIIDKDGKEIADYSSCSNMGADSAFQIGDKIYTIFEGGVAYMDLDGKNYGEISR